MPLQTYIIYPTHEFNRPTPPSKIALHGLDLLSAPIQIHHHRFYRSPPCPTTGVIDALKSSLAKALELYPPLTGKIITDEQGQQCIDMDPRHRMGTPFIVDTKDIPYTRDSENLSPRTDVILPPSSSILAVKVTLFFCGTIAIASSINHQVADLRGFLDFLELWAQLNREGTVDFTRIPDDWSRTPARFFPSPSKDFVPPPFKVLSNSATEPPAFLLAPSEITYWTLTKDAMHQLKSDFSPSNTWISSGDALTALLSGAVTRARDNANVTRLEGRSDVESQTEQIVMAADGRERAPQGNMVGKYFGNFNTLWSAIVPRSDLMSTSRESASRVALAIRNTLNLQLSPEAIANKIAFFESLQGNQGCVTWSSDVIVTNWCRFDLQGPKLDIGWGKPFASTSGGGTAFPPGYAIISQDRGTEVITMMLTIEKEGLDHLTSDVLLNKYATFEC